MTIARSIEQSSGLDAFPTSDSTDGKQKIG
jgi:hypothetical protein